MPQAAAVAAGAGDTSAKAVASDHALRAAIAPAQPERGPGGRRPGTLDDEEATEALARQVRRYRHLKDP